MTMAAIGAVTVRGLKTEPRALNGFLGAGVDVA